MKIQVGIGKKVLLFCAPLVATSTLVASPSQAATFALSTGSFEVNFNQSPLGTQTTTDTDTLAIASAGSSVVTDANADAIFVSAPSLSLPCSLERKLTTPAACNGSSSFAEGEGTNYFGLAQSEARVLGNFLINPGETFAFNFLAFLGLTAEVDDLDSERATASGEVSFQIVDGDSGTLLDSFLLAGKVDTKGNSDFITTQQNTYMTLGRSSTIESPAGKEKFTQGSIQASYSRTFANTTNLLFVETKRNQVTVKTPEPSTTIGFLLTFGLAGIGLKARKKFAN
jgi:hypothetical protein